MCGSGPAFITSYLFSADTISTTSSINPTVTANTNPMTIISTAVSTSTETRPYVFTITTATTSSIGPTTVDGINSTTKASTADSSKLKHMSSLYTTQMYSLHKVLLHVVSASICIGNYL